MESSLRTCVLSNAEEDPKGLIRLVADPDGHLVPDILGKLPGRGVWIKPDRAALAEALSDGRLLKRASRTLKSHVTLGEEPEEFMDRIDGLLTRQCLNLLGFERKTGRIVFGFEKVKDAIVKGRVAVLLEASDAMVHGTSKIAGALAKAAQPVLVVDLFDRQELSAATGRDNVVHAYLAAGGTTIRLLDDVLRLAAFRGTPIVKRGGEPVNRGHRGKQEPDDGRT